MIIILFLCYDYNFCCVWLTNHDRRRYMKKENFADNRFVLSFLQLYLLYKLGFIKHKGKVYSPL